MLEHQLTELRTVAERMADTIIQRFVMWAYHRVLKQKDCHLMP